jgi:hypothetical protein
MAMEGIISPVVFIILLHTASVASKAATAEDERVYWTLCCTEAQNLLSIMALVCGWVAKEKGLLFHSIISPRGDYRQGKIATK